MVGDSKTIVETQEQAYKNRKKQLLYLCLLIDAFGMLSYVIPVIGEWTDIITSVLTAFTIFKSFGSYGWAAFGFLEEILPFTDVIPSATIVWVYRFIILRNETKTRFIEKLNKNE